MENCVFCKIAKGTLPASMVFSDETVLAFLDMQPINMGHTLVIPKTHASDLSELDEKIGAQMFKAAMKVGAALRISGLKCEGVNLFLADGKAAFQEIFHVHLHVIPRYKGDGFGIKVGPKYGAKPDKRELDEAAQKIREATGRNTT